LGKEDFTREGGFVLGPFQKKKDGGLSTGTRQRRRRGEAEDEETAAPRDFGLLKLPTESRYFSQQGVTTGFSTRRKTKKDVGTKYEKLLRQGKEGKETTPRGR